MAKVPSGCQCGVCVNTFSALGLDAEYATLGLFYKAISQPCKREEGPKFVRGTKNLIQQLNKHPGRCKLKDKNELKEAFTIISTVDSMGDQDSGPEFQKIHLPRPLG